MDKTVQVGDLPMQLDDEGQPQIMVPNKRVSRLLQLGIHAERAERQRAARRRAERAARRKNRSK